MINDDFIKVLDGIPNLNFAAKMPIVRLSLTKLDLGVNITEEKSGKVFGLTGGGDLTALMDYIASNMRRTLQNTIAEMSAGQVLGVTFSLSNGYGRIFYIQGDQMRDPGFVQKLRYMFGQNAQPINFQPGGPKPSNDDNSEIIMAGPGPDMYGNAMNTDFAPTTIITDPDARSVTIKDGQRQEKVITAK